MKAKLKIAFDYLPVLLAFLLPFGSSQLPNVLPSLLIVLWFISSFSCFDEAEAREGLRNKWFWLILSFFLLHCVSAALSGNSNEGMRSIEIKLSFLAFSYLIFLFKMNPITIRNIFSAFVSGCFFALLACLARASFIYVTSGENYFYYNKFSFFMHTGYFSMYMLFSLVIVQLAYPAWFGADPYNKYIRWIFSALFMLGIFLCASKIGIIAFIVTGIILVLIRFKSRLNIKTVSLSLLALALIVFLLVKFVPGPFERLSSALDTTTSGNIDKASGESTAVRILIWEQSVQIIKENFLFGTGSGDANAELTRRYEENGLTGALEHNLNAHNQFLQTFIGLGLVGFVILLLITAGALVWAIRHRQIILAIFCFVIILNFLVESMLEAMAGNLFFVYFLCLLLRNEIIPPRPPLAATHPRGR